MQYEQFLGSLNQVAAVFRVEPTEAWLSGYWSVLGGIDARDFAGGCQKALNNCKFMPSPAELLQFIDSVPVPTLSLPAAPPRPAPEHRRGEAQPVRKLLPAMMGRASRNYSPPPRPEELEAIYIDNIQEAAQQETTWRNRRELLHPHSLVVPHGEEAKKMAMEWAIADGKVRQYREEQAHWRGYLARHRQTPKHWTEREPGMEG